MFNKIMEKRMNIIRNYCQWYDLLFIKISSMVFALLVAKYWDWLLIAEWYWYFFIILIISSRFIYLDYLSKKNN